MYEMRSEMKVEHIIEVLRLLDKNEPIMINFFTKEDGDERAETPLTDQEWAKAVERYEQSDWLDQVVCETFSEVVDKVVSEREKENVGHGNQSS